MKKILFCLAAVLLAATASQAQIVVGGAAGSTSILRSGDVTNAGTILAEVGYDSQFTDKLTGEIVQFTGISADGGGPMLGVGYRQFVRVGHGFQTRYPYIGFGVGGFGLGTDTPKIEELSIFVGPEFLLRLPVGDATSIATGFVGLYPAVAGQDKTIILRTGVSLSVN
jgi:hypothetical protein